MLSETMDDLFRLVLNTLDDHLAFSWAQVLNL